MAHDALETFSKMQKRLQLDREGIAARATSLVLQASIASVKTAAA